MPTISLHHVIARLKEHRLFKLIVRQGHYYYDLPNDYEFNHLSFNSKDADQQTLFFCKGAKFKVDYLLEVMKAGCLFYISEDPYGDYHPQQDGINILVTDIYKAMAIIAQEFYDHPQDRLKTIAFTGTKGKTTSAYFTKELLGAIHGEKKIAMFSTMQNTVDGVNYTKSLNSTYEALDLYRMMYEAVTNGCSHLVMEASSHGYKMNRLYHLTFDVGVFLNIAPDHIGPVEHPNFEDYLYHKLLLVQHSRKMVFNNDIEMSHLLKNVSQFFQVPFSTFSAFNPDADYYMANLSQENFTVVQSQPHQEEANISINLLGDFNRMNALAAIAAIHELEPETPLHHKEALANVVVPGRMETIKFGDNKFIYVDYAHNYLSLLNLITLVKQQHPHSPVTLVIGSTGNKAESRRKDFGELINQYIDKAMVTADDPDFEDPKAIAQEILSYVDQPQKTTIIEDREKAIETAIDQMQDNEVLLLAGKGADAFQKVQGKHLPYDGDSVIARRYIARK